MCYLAYLNKMRHAVVRTSEGLTEEQQRTPGVPSGTNLLGLIQHLTGVEEHWFQRVFLDENRDINKSMDVPADATHDEVVAAYRRHAPETTTSWAPAPTCPRWPKSPTRERTRRIRCGRSWRT